MDLFPKRWVATVNQESNCIRKIDCNNKSLEGIKVNYIMFDESILSDKCQVMFNNKTTILKYGDFKTVVKCDKRDRFIPIIGLGIALYRYYRSNKETKGMIESLEHDTKLSHLKLAEYSVNYFCNFKKPNERKLCELINNPEEGKWIELCR